MSIQQGHRYAWGAYDAIALESGSGCVQIAVIDHDLPYPLRAPQWVHASQLKPAAMRYFGNKVPA
ncbi:hypothetical protein AVMA1855_20110 [Acidovorax sp. SUPP1855]|uniref:hypothetical protein n=1 Tax=Acidovorax sp. SUPP1855 TaxID=431774 RepID=UPI0023DE1E6A|nr:hypothetical protein [Acidovorax sp. SUPP1855]GKS86496.1 hypothetical protein AVMA1855_20110 [Acidovorax sp. SUPP1855]